MNTVDESRCINTNPNGLEDPNVKKMDRGPIMSPGSKNGRQYDLQQYEDAFDDDNNNNNNNDDENDNTLSSQSKQREKKHKLCMCYECYTGV
mgnify:CR=1 FL=1